MENQHFQYNPTSEGNTENGLKVTLRNAIMFVLGLDKGYTAKYGLNPRAQAIFRRISLVSS